MFFNVDGYVLLGIFMILTERNCFQRVRIVFFK